MNKHLLRQIVVVVAAAAMIIVNALANALPLNNQTTGEISDRFDVYFVPAGYVFSIWGLIYIGISAYAIYQALPGQRDNPRLAGIGYLFVGSSAANIAWLFLWHYEQFALTLIAMFALLLFLIAIYLRLRRAPAQNARVETWVVDLPFSIYLGWISVATISNVTSVLDFYNWDGWGISPLAWTVIMIAAATGLAIAMLETQKDWVYVLVVVWALVGIAVQNVGVTLVVASALIASGVLLVLSVVRSGIGGRINRRAVG